MAPINIVAAASLVLVVVVVIAPMAAYAATLPVQWDLVTDYSSWPTKDIFVGDKLAFNYDMTHTVLVVSESDYTTCTTSNPSFSGTGGSTTYTLTEAGPVYFICGTPGHCPQMQLQVNVKAAVPTPSQPSTPTPTSSPTTPSSSATPPASAQSPPADVVYPPAASTTPSDNKNGAPASASSALLFGASLFFGTLFAFL